MPGQTALAFRASQTRQRNLTVSIEIRPDRPLRYRPEKRLLRFARNGETAQ